MMFTPADFEGGPLLVLDGDLPSHDEFQSLLLEHSFVAAADGAALRLRAYGIPPDVIIGDFDSIGEARNAPFFANAMFVEDGSQQEYDGGKSLRWLVGHDHDRVTILGTGGGMIEHVLNNFSIIARFSNRIRIKIHQGEAVGYVLRGSLQIQATPGDRISLIPLPEATLSTTGLHWNLEDEVLRTGVREGASNRAKLESVTLDVQEGTAIIFQYSSCS